MMTSDIRNNGNPLTDEYIVSIISQRNDFTANFMAQYARVTEKG